MHVGPSPAAHSRESEKQDGGGGDPQRLDAVAAVRVPCRTAILAEADDRISKSKLRDDENDSGGYERSSELRVIGLAKPRDRRREPPGVGQQHPRHSISRAVWRRKPGSRGFVPKVSLHKSGPWC